MSSKIFTAGFTMKTLHQVLQKMKEHSVRTTILSDREPVASRKFFFPCARQLEKINVTGHYTFEFPDET